MHDENLTSKQDLISSASVMESMRIERSIAYLIDHLNTLGETSVTMDSIMRDVKEGKNGRRSLRESMARNNIAKMGFNRMYR